MKIFGVFCQQNRHFYGLYIWQKKWISPNNCHETRIPWRIVWKISSIAYFARLFVSEQKQIASMTRHKKTCLREFEILVASSQQVAQKWGLLWIVRKYRAVLLGVIVMILVVGVCFYTKYRKENEIPTDGMLVYDNSEDEDVDKIWA